LVFDRKWVAGSPNVLNIELSSFLNILERFLACVTLRNATRQARNDGDVASVAFSLKDNCVTHLSLPRNLPHVTPDPGGRKENAMTADRSGL